MATRSTLHIIKPTVVVAAAATTAATVTSDAVDMAGWESLEFYVEVVTWTGGVYTFSMTECDTLGGTYTAVAAGDIATTAAWDGTLKTGVAAKSVLRAEYRGTKEFVKCVGTGTATPSANFGVLALQGFPRDTI